MSFSRSMLWHSIFWFGCCLALLTGKSADGEVIVQIGQNFTGSTYGVDSLSVPPDCNGAVGLNHYVEFINGRFSVYRKTDGHRVQTMTDLTFWSQAGVNVPANWAVSDPRIIYDPTVQRWFATDIDFDPSGVINTNRFLLAISTDADPTGDWQGVAIPSDPGGANFADFPTLGLDANGVYLSGDMFDPNQNAIGSTLVSIPKADLLTGSPVTANRTEFGTLDSAIYGNIFQPVVNFDTPAGDATVLAIGNLGLDYAPHSNLVSFAVHNAAGPGVATLTTAMSLDVISYSVPLNPLQPNGDNTLDDGDARFSAIVREVGGILYAVHGTEVSDRAAIRWYKINAADNAVLQSGTIADTNLALFYPSIAANPSGTVVIAFNGCSTNTFVSSYAVVGETVNGLTTFGNIQLLKSGVANYQVLGRGSNRWGDYSSTCVDPADPNRFWTIQMFPSALNVWSTQITELLTAIPQLSIALVDTNVLVAWPGTAVAFNLESNSDLTATNNWKLVTQNFSTNNGQVTAQIPLTNGAMFFRLHQQ